VPLPQRLLSDDESVLLEVHPHWRRLCAPIVATAAGVTIFLVAVMLWGNAPIAIAWVLTAAVVVPGLWLLRRLVWWGCTLLVITNARVLLQRGPLRRHGHQVVLRRVLHVQALQTLPERLLRTGSLVVTLRSGGVWVIDEVPNPVFARDTTIEAMRALPPLPGA
jgi:uncharacterized membrane protein YdbT with pleckstrin-like domain